MKLIDIDLYTSETDASEMSSPKRMFLILAIANVQKKKREASVFIN